MTKEELLELLAKPEDERIEWTRSTLPIVHNVSAVRS